MIKWFNTVGTCVSCDVLLLLFISCQIIFEVHDIKHMTEILFGNEIPWIWSIWCFIRTCHWFLGNASFFDDFIILSVDMALLNLAVYKIFIFSFYLKQRRISTNINCVLMNCVEECQLAEFFLQVTPCAYQ